MKNLKTALVVILLVAGFGTSNAQFSRWWYQFMAQMRQTEWVIGGGWNVVHDDGGKWFRHLFRAGDVWHIPAYPSRLTCEKYLKDGWSVEVMAAYNRYGIGNHLTDGSDNQPYQLVTTSWSLFSFDAMGKYDFNKLYDLNKVLFNDQEIIQPYGTFGLGYTYRSMPRFPHTATFNLGLGINVWVYNNWGVQLQSMSKFGLRDKFPTSGSNYLQHSIGVVYKINPKKGGAGSGSRYKFKKHRIKKGL